MATIAIYFWKMPKLLGIFLIYSGNDSFVFTEILFPEISWLLTGRNSGIIVSGGQKLFYGPIRKEIYAYSVRNSIYALGRKCIFSQGREIHFPFSGIIISWKSIYKCNFCISDLGINGFAALKQKKNHPAGLKSNHFCPRALRALGQKWLLLSPLGWFFFCLRAAKPFMPSSLMQKLPISLQILCNNC